MTRSSRSKFGGQVEEFKVSEVSEEVQLGKVVAPVAANAVLHASDVKLSGDEKLDFIAKTVLGALVGLPIGHLVDSVALKEVEVIDVEGPCGRREVDVSHLITEWSV